ncbi:hypothetical protein [Kitasatospora sp. NPDC017646]|uniref:hypothetical protein n=1 Tax=Kitasatospora sp. NPDC017646 TaxID=3364024 RepID=UPI0037A03890
MIQPQNKSCPHSHEHSLCPSESLSGRGLTLIDALCDRWGTIPRHPNAKTVWAELDLVAPDAT